MEAEQREEWSVLEQQATQLLRDGNMPGRIGVSQLFQLLVLPSFDSATSWEVCEDVKADSRYFAVRSVWRKSADLAKLATPVVRLRHPRPLQPTIQVEQYSLETVWVESVMVALKRVVVPVMVEYEGVGLDGTSYELSLDSGSARVRYRWWENPPAGWRPIDLWLRQTLKALDQLV